MYGHHPRGNPSTFDLGSRHLQKPKVFCLPPAPVPVRPVSGGLRAMETEWISALSGGRAPFLDLFSSFVRDCILLRKARRRRLPEDEINVSPPSLCSGVASSTIGGRVEVRLRQICLWWICSDLFVVRLCSCVFRLDPFDLHSLSATIAVLVCWSYGVLAQRLSDCQVQQGLSGFGERGAMIAARLRLALVLVVVARWSMNLDVIFIIYYGVRCTVMIKGE